ncbi:MAG: glycoside hydrolase family 3 C-terminal domain-containing protein [Clostridia bacterium]|nr:glycoside hydrolase family 3 C-terminal domain-containing protein [Clostridia bacterium]
MDRYVTGEARKELAGKLARSGIVMLKNEQRALPLAEGTKVALFGRTQNHTVFGGAGSGALQGCQAQELDAALEEAGFRLEPALHRFYTAEKARELREAENSGGFDFSKLEGLVNSGLIYEIFGKYQPTPAENEIGEELIAGAAAWTDTAVYVLGRSSGGEECDRRLEDDYALSEREERLISRICDRFSRVIVIMNTNGPVDLSFLETREEIRAILFIGTAGQETAPALADILRGKVSPSGKLPVTLAGAYADYPTADHFSGNKDTPERIKTYRDYGLSAEENGSAGFEMSPVTVYQEGIYTGYRYFDSFRKEPLYPFGFGLSYAEFSLKAGKVSVDEAKGEIHLPVRVQNISARFAGREAVQLYSHTPFGRMDHPWQELRAFAKTRELRPGEAETLDLAFPLRELACFDEKSREYVVEKGRYLLLTGNSSRSTAAAAALLVQEEIMLGRTGARIGLRKANEGKISFLRAEEIPCQPDPGIPELLLAPEWFKGQPGKARAFDFSVPAIKSTLRDVKEGRVSMEAFLNQLSLEELAALMVGYGPGLPFSGIGAKDAPSTIQYPDGTDIACSTNEYANRGYMNPAMIRYGIPSANYKDGPASVGMTAWPTDLMLACTFDPKEVYEFGAAIGREAVEQHVDSWLGPGCNLIRNPLEGRAFEYFSEDPCLTGILAAAAVRGAQENNPVSACPKHFALNEQETYRRGSGKKNIDAVDSIAEERTIREMYLKPFEMAIRRGNPRTVMTSFNKINGTFAGGHPGVLVDILREEWGYDGALVTDWGDMDIVVDGADAVRATDVVMPGGPPVIAQILKGYREGRVSLEDLKTTAAYLLHFVMHSAAFERYQKREEP